MKSHPLITFLFALILSLESGAQGQTSEFDEVAIRAIQDAGVLSSQQSAIVHAFETTNDPAVKAAKWEEFIINASEGLLDSSWPAPAGGWKIVDWPVSGNLSIEDIKNSQQDSAYFTRRIAQNEQQAVNLRGAGALIKAATADGEKWAERLLLNVIVRPASNLKRFTCWVTGNFAADANGIAWDVDWNAWHQNYSQGDVWGKAIVLKNITMIAIRKGEFETASAIHLSALSGSDRELKAIALAYGHSSLGANVRTKWAEIAQDSSDLQLQALAKEILAQSGDPN